MAERVVTSYAIGLREIMLLVLAVSAFILSLYGVEGSISIEDDLEFERQVELLNRGAVKIIKNDRGQVINCVDIHKQPSLSHPLLKNHTIQMRPSSYPKGLNIEASTSSSPFQMNGFRSRGEGCPQGTVPILRTRKEDLIRARSFSKRHQANNGQLTSNPPGYHFAAAKTGNSQRLKGGFGKFPICRQNVTVNQFSELVLWIENGSGDQLNSLQVGSTVNPKLYGDEYPHLFGYWTADGSRKTGCFDIRCLGFIQVGKRFTLGDHLDFFYVDVREQHFLVFKDSKTGNWWLSLPKEKEFVGYWPNSLFTSLASYATKIAWGGEVYNPLNEVKPTMGSGYFSNMNWKKSGYARHMQVVDESNTLIELANIPMNIIADYPDCYAISYNGYQGDLLRYNVFFGGPKGLNCKT